MEEWQRERWFEPLVDRMLSAGAADESTELLVQGLIPPLTVGQILEERRRRALQEIFDGK